MVASSTGKSSIRMQAFFCYKKNAQIGQYPDSALESQEMVLFGIFSFVNGM